MSDNTDFDLKHRLVGAGVLIFFGALVVPWLLGPPNDAIADRGSVVVESNDAAAGTQQLGDESSSINDDLLSALAAEQGVSDAQEEVYVSRITPADPVVDNAGKDATPKTNDPTVKSNQAEVVSRPTEQARPVETVSPTPPKSAVTDSRSSTAPASSNSATNPSNIEVGWAVQVGVFIDKNGADKVVEDLKLKSFNPQTTIVDTNKGAKTGTRVWLGPYATRVDAAKAKALLTEKTGERGFIRSYP